jgi:hypothetical protein
VIARLAGAQGLDYIWGTGTALRRSGFGAVSHCTVESNRDLAMQPRAWLFECLQGARASVMLWIFGSLVAAGSAFLPLTRQRSRTWLDHRHLA